jgi:hypothetical protein
MGSTESTEWGAQGMCRGMSTEYREGSTKSIERGAHSRIVCAQAEHKPPETLIKPPDDGPRSCSNDDLIHKILASAVAVYPRLFITIPQYTLYMCSRSTDDRAGSGVWVCSSYELAESTSLEKFSRLSRPWHLMSQLVLLTFGSGNISTQGTDRLPTPPSP